MTQSGQSLLFRKKLVKFRYLGQRFLSCFTELNYYICKYVKYGLSKFLLPTRCNLTLVCITIYMINSLSVIWDICFCYARVSHRNLMICNDLLFLRYFLFTLKVTHWQTTFLFTYFIRITFSLAYRTEFLQFLLLGLNGIFYSPNDFSSN